VEDCFDLPKVMAKPVINHHFCAGLRLNNTDGAHPFVYLCIRQARGGARHAMLFLDVSLAESMIGDCSRGWRDQRRMDFFTILAHK
jgi:hypothetical protein